ncbi:MAG: hypothetical protein JXB43_02975 [Dehalococcoidia bacterium]|nr:hypothetical protein [Dehalococcoidia bacterium]
MNMDEPLIHNDHEKIEDVYRKSEEFLKANTSVVREIATYLWAYHQSLDIVPQWIDRFGSGHFSPFSEAYYELENSFELCKQGFYRHSFFALRSVLELGVMGLYFDKDDQAQLDVKNWIKSIEPTPKFKACLDRLFELRYFKLFDGSFDQLKEIKDLYDSLSDYVHVRGYSYSTSGQTISNFNQFNEQSIQTYISLMKRVVKSTIIMMLLKYPIGMQELPLWEKFGFNPPFGFLVEEYQYRAIISVLEPKTKDFLQEISDNDPKVKEIVKGINDMPDLTEE